MLPNSADHVALFFALQTLGAVAVPVNVRSKPAGIRHVVENSEARLLVADPALRERLELPLTWLDPGDLGGFGAADRPPAAEVRPDDLSAILYTSGTTGAPKGAANSHRNTFARINSYVLCAGPRFGDDVRMFGAPPLYHAVGLQMVLAVSVFFHGTLFLVRDLPPAGQVALIERERLTVLFGSPTLYHLLLAADPEERADLGSVAHLMYASAPMPAALLAQVRRRFAAARIIECYGTTEISIPFVTVEPDVPGKLLPSADHRIRVVRPGGDPDDVLSAGEVGELIVDATNEGCFLSYWRQPDRTAERIRDGWYYTGDAFYRDEDGAYHITGRLDDMFISGGENIQPVEVEQVLAAHPGIADVAVIGTPHERWGEAVTAIVVRADPALTEEEIDTFCRGSDLDDFKRPRRVVFVEAIERNPSGKIVRKELRERVLALVAS